MNEKKFITLGIIMSVIISIVMSVSAITEKWVLGIVVLIIGICVIYQAKMRLNSKIVIEDEMVEKYINKAARITYQLFAILCSIIGLILIAFSKTHSMLFVVGSTLAFAVCIFVLMFIITYKIVTKDLKGE